MEDLDRTRKFDILEPSYRLPSRSFHREERHQNRTENGGKHEKLPRIVLKDVTGRRLDTFTHLQEAIYRARQNIRQTREALTSDEWRLPHAPAPARPDYSRAAPPMVKLRDKLRGDLVHLSKNTKTTSTKIYEVDVDDVAFVAQSINNLPSMPSLSFLRQEILREPKNYFQIVQTILLHKRFTKQTDKREAIYNFPGFCSGCRRAGLCYGCEQSLIPHYHADRLMKTGGGFTYYKKYRPENEVPGRHPLNWRVQFPELAFKSVMKGHESGELDILGEDIEHDENCLLKGLIDNQLSLPEINRDGMLTTENLVSSRQSEEKEDEGIVADRRSLEDRLSKRDHRSARMSGTSGQGSETSGQIGEGYQGDGYQGDGYQGDDFQAGGYQANDYDNFQRGDNSQLPHPRIVDLRQQDQDEDELSYDENFIRESMEKTSVGTRENEEQDGNEDTEGMDMDTSDKRDDNQEMSTDEENEDTHASRSRTRTRSTRLSQGLTASSNNRDRDNDGSYTTKSSSPFSRKFDRLYQGKAYSPEGSGSVDSRRRLYRAPPAFKIRKNERRKIKASSPFSNDRDYNLDLGKKFELKKSEKKLTQFKEFQHKGGDWKAPQQFELKKNEREEVKFWRPKHKDKEPKKRGRYRKTARPPSPDSGLDSEKTTDMRKLENSMTQLSLLSRSSSRVSHSRITRPCTRNSGDSESDSQNVGKDYYGNYSRMKNIQVHMPDVTLNEYSNGDSSYEDISYDRLFETPPHIPVVRVSLTSEEPDLELIFDDVIDVEKLEEVGEETKLPRLHRHRRGKQRMKGKVKGQNDLDDENEDEILDDTYDKQARREHSRRRRKIDENNRINETGNEILDGSSDQKNRKNHRRKNKNNVDDRLDETDKTLNDSSDRKMRRQHRRRGQDMEVDDSIEADVMNNDNKDELMEKRTGREHRRRKIDDEGHNFKIKKEHRRRRGKLSNYGSEEDGNLGGYIVVENADDENQNGKLRGERHRREKTDKNEENDSEPNKILDEIQGYDGLREGPKTNRLLSNNVNDNDKNYKHFDDLDENSEDTIFNIMEKSDSSPERGYNVEMENADKRGKYINEGGVIKNVKRISKTKLTKNVSKNQKTVRKKKKEAEEPSFDNLPSIHDTLAKILTKDKLKLLDKLKTKLTPEEGKHEETDSTTLEHNPITDERELSNIILISALTRPKSTSAECFIVPTSPRILRRTSSLPNITDMDQQNIDLAAPPELVLCQTCGEQKPELDHICLTKFKIRFKAKKTKDPNKIVCHGSNGVRRQKVKSHTDDSEVKSENTDQMTVKIQLQDRKSGATSQNTTDGSLSQCLSKDPVKEEKIPEMEERVLTPASQRISTPPDSPLPLVMSPRLPTPQFTVGKVSSPLPIRTPSPVVEKPKRVIQKKQFIKREIERKPPTPIPRSCTPQTPIPQEKEPETAIRTPEIEEDTTPIKLPELVRLDTPPLPEITEKKKEPVVKEDRRTAILPVPKLKEPLKSPTLRKKKVNMPRSTHKRSRSKQPAEAPVTKEEVQKMQDPLDFLAKYCIVSKDRLPFYERIYKNIIEGQPMRYERDPLLSPRTGMPIDKNDESNHDIGWEEHQLNMFHDLVTISRGHEVPRPGVNVPEQYLEKISYTLEILDKKQKQITDDLHMLQGKKLGHIAEMAKQMIPDISKVIYQPKAGKKSKKKKKKKNEKGSEDFDEEFPPTIPLKAEDITDEVIAMRLDEATYKKICKKGEIPQIELEMQRCAEKLAGIDDRLMELEGERNILTLYCMEVFFNEQNDNSRPIEFRRQQSALFRHLHPDPDVEMNIEELEGALQVVNNNLISESEFDYLYQILHLPGRRKINFQLFTIIAALSEKISQMDPVIKKMLIKDNPEETKKKRRSYDALDLKMETSKELFGLLADGDYETNNNGNAKASSLAVELTAGGLDPEHVGYVLSKFNRFGTGYIDFMDFVTYVPLFIEIHQKIVDDPFNVSLDV